jgi:toxin YoeB
LSVDGLFRKYRRKPFGGTGKPEPLKGEFSGWWLRRIGRERRPVYRLRDGALEVAQGR